MKELRTAAGNLACTYGFCKGRLILEFKPGKNKKCYRVIIGRGVLTAEEI